ncbi:MAG: hypothetical protein IJ191_07200, partial [Treponema sp.]|nr:hypothetical protein [Treponema sp.]
MKKEVYTIASVIILLIAALVFVVMPALVGNSQRNELPPVGSYDGQAITYAVGSDFAKTANRYSEIRRRQNQNAETGMQEYIDTVSYSFRAAFQEVLTRLAYSKAVAKSKYQPPQAAVSRVMVPYFTDENGNYSSRLYRQTSDAERTTLQSQAEKALMLARYESDLFATTEQAQYYLLFETERYDVYSNPGLTESFNGTNLYGIKSPKTETAFLAQMGSEERLFDMASFDMGNYPAHEKIAYGRSNAEKFIAYDMSVITVDDRSEAESVLRRIRNESITFVDAVSTYSRKSYSDTDGKLITNYAYQLERTVTQAADFSILTSLLPGETSDVIQTGTTYSIFQVDGDSVQPDFSTEPLLTAV